MCTYSFIKEVIEWEEREIERRVSEGDGGRVVEEGATLYTSKRPVHIMVFSRVFTPSFTSLHSIVDLSLHSMCERAVDLASNQVSSVEKLSIS